MESRIRPLITLSKSPIGYSMPLSLLQPSASDHPYA